MAEERQVRFLPAFPPGMQPAGVSYVGLSRINNDVQLDLGFMNIHQTVEQIKAQAQSEQAELPVQVLFSALLSPGAFLKLHQDVNTFYRLIVEGKDQ